MIRSFYVGPTEQVNGPGKYGGNLPWRDLLALIGIPGDAPSLHLERFTIRLSGYIELTNSDDGASHEPTILLAALITAINLQVANLPVVIQYSLSEYMRIYRLKHNLATPDAFVGVGSADTQVPSSFGADAAFTTGLAVTVPESSSKFVAFAFDIPIQWVEEHDAEPHDFVHPVGLFRDTVFSWSLGPLSNAIVAGGNADVSVASIAASAEYRWEFVALPYTNVASWTVMDRYHINTGDIKPANIPLYDGMIDAACIAPTDGTLFTTADLQQLGVQIGAEVVTFPSTDTWKWWSEYYHDAPVRAGGLAAAGPAQFPVWPLEILLGSTTSAGDYTLPFPIISASDRTKGQTISTDMRYGLNVFVFQLDSNTVSGGYDFLRWIRYSQKSYRSTILAKLGMSQPDMATQKLASGKRGTANPYVAMVAPWRLPLAGAGTTAADQAAQQPGATVAAPTQAANTPRATSKGKIKRK